MMPFHSSTALTNMLANQKLDTNSPDTTKEDSWIWRTGPVGKGKMSEKDVAEWYEKCACNAACFNVEFVAHRHANIQVILSNGIAQKLLSIGGMRMWRSLRRNFGEQSGAFVKCLRFG